MKKLLILTCAFSFLLLPFNLALALQATNSVTVTVTVQGSFNLIVDTDSFDFARLAPKQTGEMTRSEGVAVTGTSSGGNPWYLKVSTIKPLTSGSNTIPNENFTWYGTSEGAGAWYGTAEKSLADTGAAYASSAEEANKAGKVVNRFKFRLHVPEDTKPGDYRTTVMFTMTE
jgi:hypothetical protein